MKGTLFSADFIEDLNGNLRLLELNTDTTIPDNAVSHIDFSGLVTLFSQLEITEVHVISKGWQSKMVELLAQTIADTAPFITSFTNTVEGDTTIYPELVEDSPSKFILRMAYDESAIFDSEYAKNKVNLLNLFSEDGDTSSIPQYFIASTANGTKDFLPEEFNSSNMPDVAIKDLNLNVSNPISFYKIGKSGETAADRYSEFKSLFPENNLILKFYENTAETKVTSIRSLNIIYGPNIDMINIGNFVSQALFEKPETIEFDDNEVANKTNTKHYYELTTNYPKFSSVTDWGGIFEEEQVIKADGLPILISDAVVGTELRSYFIEGAPDTDLVSEFMQWEYPGSQLPDGSYETSSTVVNQIEQSLTNNVIFHITMEDGSDFRASGGSHLLVYDIQKDVLRYESIMKIDSAQHELVNLSGSTVAIQSVVGEILDGDYKSYIMDMESADTFFLYNGELSIKIVTHNCFPAGTKITLSDGSDKNIEDLTIEDKLLTYNEKTGELSEGAIGNIVKKKEFLLIHLTTDDGSAVKSTPLHKFYVKGKGWVAAQDVIKGDVMIKKDKTETTVVEREDLSGEVDVYHIIDVRDNHTYFAEGLLVHNFKYGSCFVKGTKVMMADGTEKNIEDIVMGDIVVSFNESTLTNENKKVVGLKSPVHFDLVQYTFTDNTTLTCTFDHPLYKSDLELVSYVPEWTNSRYQIGKDVTKIKEGDLVKLSTNSFVALKEIKVLDPVAVDTFIITVEDNHNFYANNILVHNK
jgi:hypothetical protein